MLRYLSDVFQTVSSGSTSVLVYLLSERKTAVATSKIIVETEFCLDIVSTY